MRVVCSVVFVAVLVGGCSFVVGVEGSNPTTHARTCTAVAPVLDLAMMAAAAALFIGAASEANKTYGDEKKANDVAFQIVGIPSLLAGVATGISAVYGFSEVRTCRRQPQRDDARGPAQPAVGVAPTLTIVQARFLAATRLARAGACTRATAVGESLAELDWHAFQHLRRNHNYARCRNHLCSVDPLDAVCLE